MMQQTVTSKAMLRASIKNYIKKIISKDPQIYIGNLEWHILQHVSGATKREIAVVFHQLSDDGWFLHPHGIIQPPHQVDPQAYLITLFVARTDLSWMDLDLLLMIHRKGLEFGFNYTVSIFTRKFVSLHTDYDEGEVWHRLGQLFTSGILKAQPSNEKPETMVINWDFIQTILNRIESPGRDI